MAESTAVQERLATAYNHFAVDLLQALLKTSPNENIVISPLSVAMALSMAHAAAADETQKGIARTLHHGSSGLETHAGDLRRSMLNQTSVIEERKAEAIRENKSYVEVILKRLDEEAGLAAVVELATSLWGAEHTALSADFRTLCEQHFGASVESIDFDAPESVAVVNQWVSEATHHKITNILSNVNPATILMLISTVYLKAKWDFKFFDPHRTKQQPFTLPDGSQKQHPIMYHMLHNPYREDEHFQVVQLGFEGGRLRMWVCLPAEGLPLSHLQEFLTPATLQQWQAQLDRRWGKLGLPRFRSSSTTSLSAILSALGMERAFDPHQAQFPAITSPQGATYLSDVIHSAMVEVNEAGVEASGVSIMLFAGGAGPHDPFEMIVDRPFFWLIDDTVTGAILFAGVTTDPQETPAALIDHDDLAGYRGRFGNDDDE